MPALTTNQSVEAATGNIPELRLPDLHPFAGRARRLRQLAVGHSLGDYLSFAATLAAGDEWLETQADLLLAGDRQGLDVACAPVIGAALQVYWTRLAAALDPAWIARREAPGLCPVCGGPPVAGVVRSGDADHGLRYLHCILCGSQWHVVRARCSHCDNPQGIVYYTVEDCTDPVQAKACPECRSYLKLCRMDQDSGVEPLADDLASLALDLLMSEEGFARSGVNYLMLQSD